MGKGKGGGGVLGKTRGLEESSIFEESRILMKKWGCLLKNAGF